MFQFGQNVPPPDMLLLYWTLVAEGAVPSGYEDEILELGTGIKQASDRLNRRSTQEDNLSAAVWLHRYRESEAKEVKLTKQAVDQFMLASLDRPARFKCRTCSKARRRGELSQEMSCSLDGLLRGTKTPMGERLVNSAPGRRVVQTSLGLHLHMGRCFREKSTS